MNKIKKCFLCASLMASGMADTQAVTFEPIVTLFSTNPALDISYRDYNLNISVDNFEKHISCALTGDFAPVYRHLFSAKGFNSLGTVLFDINPQQYQMPGGYGNRNEICVEEDVSVAASRNRRNTPILVVGMKAQGRVVIALADPQGRRLPGNPELTKLPDDTPLYDIYDYAVGEFNRNLPGEELRVRVPVDIGSSLISDSYELYYYELSTLRLINKIHVVVSSNGEISIDK